MERLTSVATAHNKCKKKKKPIKVVYISNPMRVWTSESDFLALVQKLTGRDSDVAESMVDKVYDPTVQLAPPKESSSGECYCNIAKKQEDQALVEMYRESIVNPFDMLEGGDQFSAMMLENFPRFMTSSVIYDADLAGSMPKLGQVEGFAYMLVYITQL